MHDEFSLFSFFDKVLIRGDRYEAKFWPSFILIAFGKIGIYKGAVKLKHDLRKRQFNKEWVTRHDS